jgi:hypothetical protein
LVWVRALLSPALFLRTLPLQDCLGLDLFDDDITVPVDDLPATLFSTVDVRYPDGERTEFLTPGHTHLSLFNFLASLFFAQSYPLILYNRED